MCYMGVTKIVLYDGVTKIVLYGSLKLYYMGVTKILLLAIKSVVEATKLAIKIKDSSKRAHYQFLFSTLCVHMP